MNLRRMLLELSTKSTGKSFNRLFKFIEEIKIPELGERKFSIILGAAIYTFDEATTLHRFTSVQTLRCINAKNKNSFKL